MIEFIVKYWLEFAFGALVGWLAAWFKKRKKEDELRNAEYNALKQAMIAILHDRLYQACTHYITLGYIPISKYEEIRDNMKLIYEAYHALGGNGTGTDIYERFKALPLKSADSEKEESFDGNSLI